jgi:hypothetical protein
MKPMVPLSVDWIELAQFFVALVEKRMKCIDRFIIDPWARLQTMHRLALDRVGSPNLYKDFGRIFVVVAVQVIVHNLAFVIREWTKQGSCQTCHFLLPRSFNSSSFYLSRGFGSPFFLISCGFFGSTACARRDQLRELAATSEKQEC